MEHSAGGAALRNAVERSAVQLKRARLAAGSSGFVVRRSPAKPCVKAAQASQVRSVFGLVVRDRRRMRNTSDTFARAARPSREPPVSPRPRIAVIQPRLPDSVAGRFELKSQAYSIPAPVIDSEVRNHNRPLQQGFLEWAVAAIEPATLGLGRLSAQAPADLQSRGVLLTREAPCPVAWRPQPRAPIPMLVPTTWYPRMISPRRASGLRVAPNLSITR